MTSGASAGIGRRSGEEASEGYFERGLPPGLRSRKLDSPMDRAALSPSGHAWDALDDMMDCQHPGSGRRKLWFSQQ